MTPFIFLAQPTQEQAEAYERRQARRQERDTRLEAFSSLRRDRLKLQSDAQYSDECLAQAKAERADAESMEFELYGRALRDTAPEAVALTRSMQLNREAHHRLAMAVTMEILAAGMDQANVALADELADPRGDIIE